MARTRGSKRAPKPKASSTRSPGGRGRGRGRRGGAVPEQVSDQSD